MHNVRREHRTAEQEAVRKQAEAGKIEVYRKLESFQQHLRSSGQFEKAFDSNTQILTANPENYTMWNFRREILARKPEQLAKELYWMVDLLKRFPKNYWIWNHRGWVLQQLNSTKAWKQELELVGMFLERDGRNFHGWHYRRQVISELEKTEGSQTKSELDYTTAKINKNISNYSAYHNRILLLQKNPPSEPLFRQEIEYAKNAVMMDPNDQSAWNYYRWLVLAPFWQQYQPQVYERELKDLQELCAEEETLQLLQTIWMLSKSAGSEVSGLRARLAELDPQRANRYLGSV